VKQVLVDFNSVVHKGDVLAVIDPEIYTTQVNSQEANVMAQRAQEQNAKAAIESARANRDLAKVVYVRTQRLLADKLASQSDLDTAKGNLDATSALYDESLAALAAQRAQVQAQTSQLRQVTANLGYTKIYAPVDGVVVTRSIDPGATVVGSFQSPVLFVIAQDLRKMRVLADVDEADVGKLKEGMDAEAVVDAFPGEAFRGVVQQVRFSPNTVSGVVTYSAVIEVANPDAKLRPGMTATVTIRTREVKQAEGIPNSALRYKPTPPKGPDDKPIPPPPQPPLAKGQGRVYVMTSEKPGDEKAEERLIAIGITDGLNTQVMPGALPAGTKVVTDENDEKKKKMF
jgi:HlyD family secretion protein